MFLKVRERGMKTEHKQAFDNITDTFTGSDGGVKFLMFKVMLESLSYQSLNGDKEAEQIMNIVVQFSKLIDIYMDSRSYDKKGQ
jgi:hypothetical protein